VPDESPLQIRAADARSRWLARITGIAPIGVPATRMLIEGRPRTLTRTDRATSLQMSLECGAQHSRKRKAAGEAKQHSKPIFTVRMSMLPFNQAGPGPNGLWGSTYERIPPVSLS